MRKIFFVAENVERKLFGEGKRLLAEDTKEKMWNAEKEKNRDSGRYLPGPIRKGKSGLITVYKQEKRFETFHGTRLKTDR